MASDFFFWTTVGLVAAFGILLFYVWLKTKRYPDGRTMVACSAMQQISTVAIVAFPLLNGSFLNVLAGALKQSGWLDQDFQLGASPLWVAGLAALLGSFIVVIAVSRIRQTEAPQFTRMDEMAGFRTRLPEDEGVIKDVLRLFRLMWYCLRGVDPTTPAKLPDRYSLDLAPKQARPWQDFALSLLCQEQSAYSEQGASFSSDYGCLVVTKNDPVSGAGTCYLFTASVMGDVPAEGSPAWERLLAGPRALAESGKAETNARMELLIDAGRHCFVKELTLGPNAVPLRVATKTYLIRRSLQLDDYAVSLRRRFATDPNPLLGGELGLTLDQMYAPLTVAPCAARGGAHKSAPSLPLDDVLKRFTDGPASGRALLLLGEFGQGKSTAALRYAAQWAQAYLNNESWDSPVPPVPLLLLLRGQSPKDETQEDLLAKFGNEYGLKATALMHALEAGEAILIAEGFDELKEGGDRLCRFEHFKTLWSFPRELGCRLILTGRPNFFFNATEARDLLDDRKAECFRLNFLTLDDIGHALRHVPETVRCAILQLAAEDPAFRGIAGRPSLLPVLVSVWPQLEEMRRNGETVTYPKAIKIYLQKSIERKYKEVEKRRDTKARLHPDTCYLLMQAVALQMLKEGNKNTISARSLQSLAATLRKQLDRYVKHEDWHQEEAEEWGKFVRQTEELAKKSGKAPEQSLVDALSHFMRSEGVLAPDPAAGPDAFYFPHKQFFEFLAAEYFYRRDFPNNERDELITKFLSSIKTKDLFYPLFSNRNDFIIFNPLSILSFAHDLFSLLNNEAILKNYFLLKKFSSRKDKKGGVKNLIYYWWINFIRNLPFSLELKLYLLPLRATSILLTKILTLSMLVSILSEIILRNIPNYKSNAIINLIEKYINHPLLFFFAAISPVFILSTRLILIHVGNIINILIFIRQKIHLTDEELTNLYGPELFAVLNNDERVKDIFGSPDDDISYPPNFRFAARRKMKYRATE